MLGDLIVFNINDSVLNVINIPIRGLRLLPHHRKHADNHRHAKQDSEEAYAHASPQFRIAFFLHWMSHIKRLRLVSFRGRPGRLMYRPNIPRHSIQYSNSGGLGQGICLAE